MNATGDCISGSGPLPYDKKSPGTANMITLARKKGLPVRVLPCHC